MKELSIEEKAKHYDEALKVLHKYDGANIMFTQDLKEEMFPELAESEDERIRKAIKKALQVRCDGSRIISDEPVTLEEAIAWLEKQGEQKVPINDFKAKDWYVSKVDGKIRNIYHSVDKVEPKFKVGDWIVNNINKDIFLIKSINNGYCTLEDIKGNIISPCLPPCESESHIWTIQDAKDGDVLEFGDHGRLVVGIVSYVNKATGKVDVSCLLENNTFKVGNYYNLDTIKPHPATKEQRDLLFQKMHEAGYEWDAEKKELKKIEQKPVEWSEEDEKYMNALIDKLETLNFYNDSFSIGGYSVYIIANWLKSLRSQKLSNMERNGKNWKPSEEQIIALRWVLSKIPYNIHKEEISGLLDQIKDL